MPDFWKSCGHSLLAGDAPGGRLRLSAAFLRAYLRRAELVPPDDACAAERALHAELLEAPMAAVAARRVDAFADPDAAENWRLFLGFRETLLAAGSLEDAYLAVVAGGARPVAPLFVDHLVHVVLRHLLGEGCRPLEARAAEMLFRAQKIGVHDGRVLAADAETVAARRGGGELGPLAAFAEKTRRTIGQGAAQPGVELDVMRGDDPGYWARDERHDLALDIGFGAPGLDALCRVLERWTAHFIGTEVSIQPVGEISDARWRWHVGLDAEAMVILNRLYEGETLSEDTRFRLLALFRLTFADPARMRADVAGRPVYLAMAMDAKGRLRLKPQNLLLNLPLAEH